MGLLQWTLVGSVLSYTATGGTSCSTTRQSAPGRENGWRPAVLRLGLAPILLSKTCPMQRPVPMQRACGFGKKMHILMVTCCLVFTTRPYGNFIVTAGPDVGLLSVQVSEGISL